MLRLIVFEWKLERFADAEAMSPAMLWRVYVEFQTHRSWLAKLRNGKV